MYDYELGEPKMSTGGRRGAEKLTLSVRMSMSKVEPRRRNGDRSMRGSIWSNLGHLGLPDLVASTIMDASNSDADGRADKPSDSRLAVSNSKSKFEFEPLHING